MTKRRTPEQATIAYRRRPARQHPAGADDAAAPLHVPVPERRRRRHSQSKPFPWRTFLVLGTLLALFVAVLLSGGLLLFLDGDTIAPGVHTLGVPLGGQTQAEAAATLDRHWQARTITLEADGQQIASSPQALGFILDARATAARAYAQTRSLEGLADALRAIAGDEGFTPVWYFDPSLADSRLRDVAQSLYVAPVDAGVEVVDGQARATAAVPGRELDVPATLSRLQQNSVGVIGAGRLSLVMVTVPPNTVDAQAMVDEANRLLSTPLHVSAYDPITDETFRWTVPPAVWGEWLTLEIDPAGQSPFTWHVNPESGGGYLANQADALQAEQYLNLDQTTAAMTAAIRDGSYSARLRVYHRDTQYTVQPGDTLSSIARAVGIPYPWIQQANPGIGDGLSVGQTITIPSPDALLPLPVVEDKRVVVSISQQRMWAYENGALRWEWPVSTGIESSPTAPGVFQIQSHEPNAYAGRWDLWMPHFLGIYRPVPTVDFMNGFHGFPTRGGNTLLWTGDLGHPVTYGCILVSSSNAEQLYSWADEGVVVEVRP